MSEKKLRKPRGEERKDRDLHMRLTKSQSDFIEMLSYEHEKTKTDIIMRALEFYHNCEKGSF